MVYLVTNITDSSPKPMRISLGDIPGRVVVELDPGETVDLERFSTRNQILDAKSVRVHLQEGRITVDTLGTQPRDRIFVDAAITGGVSVSVGTVGITEPIEISASVNGTETTLTATQDGSTVALDVSPLFPDDPTVVGIPVAAANSEQSYAFPLTSRCFRIAVREGDANLKVAFSAGATNTTDYLLVRKGISYSEHDVDAGSLTVYFQVDKPNRTVEVMSWAI